MTEYLTEQEQIELIKNWIKQYSLVILAGVIIAAIAIFGWRYWQQRQYKMITHASVIYDSIITKRTQNDIEGVIAQSEKLVSRYPQTTYAQMAALMLAREAIVKQNYAEASKQLTWVIRKSSIPSIRQIAKIRLARVLLAMHKPEESIKTLQKIEDKNFNGLTNEVKGDAYLAMKNIPMARQYYQQALTELPNAEVTRPLLQMKFDDLATTIN